MKSSSLLYFSGRAMGVWEKFAALRSRAESGFSAVRLIPRFI
jgi:hypothetical protein